MKKLPLYVDLDDTFIQTDILFETFILLIKKNVFKAMFSLVFLLSSRAKFKDYIARNTDLNVNSIPINQSLYAFLRSKKGEWSKVVLATATHAKNAKLFKKHYEDIFDDVLSSSDSVNLKADKKLSAILSQTDEFDYIGDSTADLVLFKSAANSYFVGNEQKFNKEIQFRKVFARKRPNLKSYLKQIRLHQWVKNTLLFVPLLTSGLFLEPQAIFHALLGFIAFGLVASSTYVLNDLFDLEADRLHPRKKNRPIAAGLLSIKNSVVLAFSLLLFALFIFIFLPLPFALIMLIYVIATLSYSFKLKQYIGIDTVLLASLYTIRIIAGALIINVPLSFWLLAFSMFVFFSLALVKRCSELKTLEQIGQERVRGRDYSLSDYHVLSSIGAASSMMSVLMFCFYLNSDVLIDQYSTPNLLWGVFPLLAYWLMRVWIKTNRGEMTDDPIVFALKDKGSFITIGAIILLTVTGKLL